MDFVGLNDLRYYTKVISTNLILRAKYERELKIVPVATVTRVAGYGCLVDGDEEKTKRRKGEEGEIRKKRRGIRREIYTTGGFMF